ncbi:hypothetical protein RND81_09G227700 [Saponaria officinalis]|uniref:F-box domain-containing protein n=1 Tax=Saponaria officinalis TaxID=3572 RepID=A0AAW1IRA4_SAPOF
MESVVPILPDDIIHYNILTRVPVVSLLRFKCVSKTWYGLLKSSDFNLVHQKRTLEFHNSSEVIIASYDHQHDGLACTYIDASQPLIGRDVTIKIDEFNTTTCCKIVGSCNGLILLWSSSSGLALCNPLTREYRRLSYPPRELDTTGTVAVTCVKYGFGYDCLSHHYKIFMISSTISYLNTTTQRNSEIQVFSTNTNSWRKIGDVPPFEVLPHNEGVVVNNKLHWIYSDFEVTAERSPKILTCDLHTEEFEFGPFQFPYTEMTDLVTYLMGSGGLLYVIMGKAWNFHDSIWVMKEYGVSDFWIKVVNFERNLIYRVGSCKLRREGGEVLLIKHDSIHSSSLVKFEWYNFRDGSTKNVEISPGSWRHFISVVAWECISSLTPIPGNDHKYSWVMDKLSNGETTQKSKISC